jgi:hypothetical protein
MIQGSGMPCEKAFPPKHIHMPVPQAVFTKLHEPTNNPNFAKETNFDNVQ